MATPNKYYLNKKKDDMWLREERVLQSDLPWPSLSVHHYDILLWERQMTCCHLVTPHYFLSPSVYISYLISLLNLSRSCLTHQLLLVLPNPAQNFIPEGFWSSFQSLDFNSSIFYTLKHHKNNNIIRPWFFLTRGLFCIHYLSLVLE